MAMPSLSAVLVTLGACVQQQPRREQEKGLNAPCWPLGQKDLLTEGHSMWDPGSLHVQLYNACGNSIPGLGRALGQIKWTHDVSWRQDMPAASVLLWLGLGPWGRSNHAAPPCPPTPSLVCQFPNPCSVPCLCDRGLRTTSKKEACHLFLTQRTDLEKSWILT